MIDSFRGRSATRTFDPEWRIASNRATGVSTLVAFSSSCRSVSCRPRRRLCRPRGIATRSSVATSFTTQSEAPIERRDRLPLPQRNKTKHCWPLRIFYLTIVCRLGVTRHSFLSRQPTAPCMDVPSETAMGFRFRVMDTRVRRSVLVCHSCTTMNCQQRVEPRPVQAPAIWLQCAYFHRMGARAGPSSSGSPDARSRLSQRSCHEAPRNADAC